METPIQLLKNEEEMLIHYYGDIVRKLFILGALIILLTLPIFQNLLPAPTTFSIALVIILGFFAGLMSPKNRWIVLFNALISAGALFVFEHYGALLFLSPLQEGYRLWLFITNIILAIIFLFALYYSTKTLRAIFLRKN